MGPSNRCETCEIFECLDPVEYAALVEPAKDGLRLILSCGAIDTHEGTLARTALFQIFPSGVTHNKLVALFASIPPGHP